VVNPAANADGTFLLPAKDGTLLLAPDRVSWESLFAAFAAV
jgi:hypothetical protein